MFIRALLAALIVASLQVRHRAIIISDGHEKNRQRT
jgi:hypothetical protein